MKHITIVSEDRVGLLADISYILGAARVNIETLSAEVQGPTCIVNLSIKDEKRATGLLRNNGYNVLESELIIVRIKDEPAQMASFTSLLSSEKISILSMHPIAKEGGFDTFSLKVDHVSKARKVLAAYLVNPSQTQAQQV